MKIIKRRCKPLKLIIMGIFDYYLYMIHREVPSYYEIGLDLYILSSFILYNSRDDKYSAFIRNLQDGGGYTFVYGKNICYNTKRHMYVFLMNNTRLSLTTGHSDAFTYGWRWYNTKNSTEDINAVWIDKPSYITQPYTIHHIYHFVESINFLWTKLLLPNRFPPVYSFSSSSLIL